MENTTPSNDPADSTSIFVYGALMRGMDLHHYLTGATFIACGWTAGSLVSLGRYPGLLLHNGGRVRGELYRLHDAAVSLEALDDLENYDPLQLHISEYVRCIHSVHTDDGAEVAAWMYIYNQPTHNAPVVPDGDWRRYVKA